MQAIRFVLSSLVAVLLAMPGHADDSVPTGANGLYEQPWFNETFLEFGDDLQNAADEGKHLLVLVEQVGCPYCRELHQVNFQRPEIVDYLKQHFVVVQLDLFGARGTVDFDGAAMEERDLVFKWGAQFTPTSIIFAAENAGATDFSQAEAFRLPGYLKPFHYLAALEYVVSGEYQAQSFQRFLKARIEDLSARGITPDVW